jgi:nitrite reductase/ring-hydroxylating ferredoxin subunit
LLLGSGGWMGGTLSFRNQIGVDHRYAGAGKWKEMRIGKLPADGAAVAKESDLAVNQMMLLHVGDARIVLARTESGYAAFDDRCTHKGGSLAGGVLMCGTVQCPWHGSQFNVETGAVTAGPAAKKIGVHRVEMRNGEIWLMR